LRALSKRYEIAFVTSRPVSWEDATHVYIESKLKGIAAGIHFTEKREGISKGLICRELGAVWHIDDNPDHCQSVIDEGIKAILFGEYGWQYRTVEGAIPCKDWAAVAEYLGAV
jgi:hypothetical protein